MIQVYEVNYVHISQIEMNLTCVNYMNFLLKTVTVNLSLMCYFLA